MPLDSYEETVAKATCEYHEAILAFEALEAAEHAEQVAANCEEHDASRVPESCEHCFPSADEARLKRWAALGMIGPAEPPAPPAQQEPKP